jgi:hypothetical protein
MEITEKLSFIIPQIYKHGLESTFEKTRTDIRINPVLPPLFIH